MHETPSARRAKRRTFSDEVKQDAVRLTIEGESTAVALGVGEQGLRQWHRTQASKAEHCGDDAMLDELREENKRLRRAEVEQPPVVRKPADAWLSVFKYIDTFYYLERLHQTLGCHLHDPFEDDHAVDGSGINQNPDGIPKSPGLSQDADELICGDYGHPIEGDRRLQANAAGISAAEVWRFASAQSARQAIFNSRFASARIADIFQNLTTFSQDDAKY